MISKSIEKLNKFDIVRNIKKTIYYMYNMGE